MSSFYLNPNFKNELSAVLDRWVEEIFKSSDKVISEPRYWDGWVTSNPFRDIIDTEELRKSGKVIFISTLKRQIQWSTSYVTYVYYGYSLQDGRQIPARKWIEVAYEENDYKEILVNLINKKLASS